nr:glycosyltransferase [uncultured Carboxylicivirga sp.]
MNLFYFGADDSWETLLKQGFHRRNTNLLKAFTRSNKIDKVYNLRRVTKNTLLNHLINRYRNNSIEDVYYCSFLPDNWFKPLNILLAKLIIFFQIGKKIQSNDIIWCYWPSGFLQAEYINPGGRWFFDADHNIVDDPNLEKDKYKERITILQRIESHPKMHAVISSTRSMLKWFNNESVNLIRLRNGVDTTRFNIPANKVDHSTIIIGYCGTLSRWMNWEWLIQLVDDFPEYTFQIIGKAYKSEEYKKLLDKPNVALLGFQPADQIPQLMENFSVALGLYNNHPAMDVDSMKIYEYLAAGIPVVCNNYHSWLKEDFDDLLYIADSYKELKENILNALNNTTPQANNFLQQATWQNRVEQFLTSIE